MTLLFAGVIYTIAGSLKLDSCGTVDHFLVRLCSLVRNRLQQIILHTRASGPLDLDSQACLYITGN